MDIPIDGAAGSAGSLDSFQATCSRTIPNSLGVCSGSSDSSFTFSGPFLAGRDVNQSFAPGEIAGVMDFQVGSLGGAFTYEGDSCTHADQIGGKPCEGEVVFGSFAIVTPSDTGLSLGDVVSVVGPSTAQGFFCDPCNGPFNPIFDIPVSATYQFTLTAPGAPAPFTLTGAQVSSVPEPGAWALATLGLAAVAAGFFGRCRTGRARS